MQAPSDAPRSLAGSVLLSAVGTGLPHIDAQDADAAVWWMRFLLPAPPRPSGDAQALAGTGFRQMADAFPPRGQALASFRSVKLRAAIQTR